MITKPEYEPTESDRNTVNAMAACGFSHEAIAACLGESGIDPKTLRKHFRKELDTAAHKANARVGQVAFAKAVAGEPWAVCFWMKCRAGWRETQTIQHTGTGPDGQIEIGISSAAAILLGKLDSIASRRAEESATIESDGSAGPRAIV